MTEWSLIFLPILLHIPTPAVLLLTGTFSPWRMGRRGFSFCCYYALELWASRVSSDSAESHWTSWQCRLLIWYHTSMKDKVTGLRGGHTQHSEKSDLPTKAPWGPDLWRGPLWGQRRLGEKRSRILPFPYCFHKNIGPLLPLIICVSRGDQRKGMSEESKLSTWLCYRTIREMENLLYDSHHPEASMHIATQLDRQY